MTIHWPLCSHVADFPDESYSLTSKAHSELHAAFRTSKEAAAGKRVEFSRVEWDPHYRLRNQTIIEWLEITPEEEREMSTVISDDERRRRDRAREDPEMTRTEYLTRAAKRRAAARRMAAAEALSGEIAREAGCVSKSSVQKALRSGWTGWKILQLYSVRCANCKGVESHPVVWWRSPVFEVLCGLLACNCLI